MGNRVHTDTHIYPVSICVMTCMGISEIGTWKLCKHTTGILVGDTVYWEGLWYCSICNIYIAIIEIHIHMCIFMRMDVYNDTHSWFMLLSNHYCYTYFFSGKNLHIYTDNNYEWYQKARNADKTRIGERWGIRREDHMWHEAIGRSRKLKVDCYKTDFRRETAWSEKGQYVERTAAFEY